MTAASVVVAGALIYASVRAVLAHLRWQATREAVRLADETAMQLRESVTACERRLLQLEGLRRMRP